MVRLICLAILAGAAGLSLMLDRAERVANGPLWPLEQPQVDEPVHAVDIGAEADAIDQLLAAAWDEHGITPNPLADDATFLRRAYLDIIGRGPTVAEARTWLADTGPEKHRRLIGELHAAPGRLHRDYIFWADMLRLKTRDRLRSGEAYAAHLRSAIAANTPYDEWVRELLTASGSPYEDGNGAVGYYLRDPGMAQDNLANSIQVFLATQIQCAQCHDHPFDVWTQKDFLQLAAFVQSTRSGRSRQVARSFAFNPRTLRQHIQNNDLSVQQQQLARRTLRLLSIGVDDGDRDLITVPADVRGEALKPGTRLTAKPLFGRAPAGDMPPRQRFARWLTDPHNPRFTKVISNRLWRKIFGRGLIEPIDDWTEASSAAIPLLLDHLANLMRRLDYDLVRFQRILASTEAYRRQATDGDLESGAPYYFPGPVLRRLTAEELWDSVMTLVVPDLDQRTTTHQVALAAQYRQLKAMESESQVVAFIKERSDAQLAVRKLQKRRRALVQQMKRVPRSDTAKLQQLKARLQELKAEYAKLEAAGGAPAMMARGARRSRPEGSQDPRWRGLDRGFVRAAELPSPAPEGHFLRQFGQSDREQIDNAHQDPNVTQALSLLNGYIDQRLLKRGTLLHRTVSAGQSLDQRINALWLAILARPPAATERELAVTTIQGGGDEGYADLAWALLNSHEFMFKR